MRPVVVTLTGNGATTANSAPVIVDWRASPFNIGLAIDTGGSTTGFTAQYCYEDPNSYTTATLYNANAKWWTLTALSAKTADTDSSLTIPCRAVRLQANASGTDTATMTIVQGGGAL